MLAFDSSTALAILAILLASLSALYSRWSGISAQRSANTADLALTTTQRAFILSPQIDAINIINPSTRLLESIALTPLWKNQGLTPAVKLIIFTEFTLIEAGNEINLNFEDPPADAVLIDAGPQSTFQGSHREISAQDVIRIREGTARLIVWGYCEYNDVFPNTPRHKLKYSFEAESFMDPRTPVNPANAETFFLRFNARNFHEHQIKTG